MAATDVRVDRILCAVTFSPASRRVVGWAAALAGKYDGEVRLFHALPGGDAHGAAANGDSDRVLKKLFALAHGLPGRPRISAAVTEGNPAAEILRHARLVRADLIAIGMHARDGGVSPLIARVAIDAPCPVLVVDETQVPAPPGVREHIVVAVNFLPASLAAAEYAFALAQAAGGGVTAVHVLPEHWDSPHRHDSSDGEPRQLVERHFRQLLHIAVGDIAGSPRHRDEIVTSGRPCVELTRIAAARNADLIVMGIDAAGAPEDGFGETSGCVMQYARRTVLLVPERLFRQPNTGRRDRGVN